MSFKSTFLLLSFFTARLIPLNAQNWSELATGVVDTNHRTWALKILDDNVVWMSSVETVFPPGGGPWLSAEPRAYRSLDGGLNWEVNDMPIDSVTFWDIAPVDSLTAFAASGPLLKTIDGGATWEVVTSYEDFPIYTHFFNEMEGWIAGVNFGDLRFGLTSDGGETWTYVGGLAWDAPDSTSIPERIGFERPEIAYSLMNGSYDIHGDMIVLNMWGGTYWVSYDKGYNWERKYTPMFDLGYSASTVAIKDSLTYLFTGDTDTLYNFVTPFSYYTNDGGNTWTEGELSINTATSTYVPNAGEETYIVSGQYFNLEGTQITQDNGATWTTIDSTRIIVADFDESGRGVGTFGDILAFGDFVENGKIYTWFFEPNSTDEDVIDDYSFRIFPNPVSDVLTLEYQQGFYGESVHVKIIGLDSRVHHSVDIQISGQQAIPVHDLTSGSYYLTIQSEGKMVLKQFVKM